MDVDALSSLSADRPVLLVCLRHLGCAFSREALADLQAQRAAIDASGARLVIAHLEPPSAAEPLLRRYGLADVPTISDPTARVYESCGLERGSAGQIVGPRVLWRWLTAAIVERRGAGWTGADVRRMPGAFLIRQGRIVRAFRHRTTADRPDYVSLCFPE
ncbi:MAG: SelL-related redox protein [Vicinamibacterales bacterium]